MIVRGLPRRVRGIKRMPIFVGVFSARMCHPRETDVWRPILSMSGRKSANHPLVRVHATPRSWQFGYRQKGAPSKTYLFLSCPNMMYASRAPETSTSPSGHCCATAYARQNDSISPLFEPTSKHCCLAMSQSFDSTALHSGPLLHVKAGRQRPKIFFINSVGISKCAFTWPSIHS